MKNAYLESALVADTELVLALAAVVVGVSEVEKLLLLPNAIGCDKSIVLSMMPNFCCWSICRSSSC